MSKTMQSESPSAMCELLLTVLALSQESYKGPLSHAIPKRLTSALRRARKANLVCVDEMGIYLEEEGAAYLDGEGLTSGWDSPW